MCQPQLSTSNSAPKAIFSKISHKPTSVEPISLTGLLAMSGQAASKFTSALKISESSEFDLFIPLMWPNVLLNNTALLFSAATGTVSIFSCPNPLTIEGWGKETLVNRFISHPLTHTLNMVSAFVEKCAVFHGFLDTYLLDCMDPWATMEKYVTGLLWICCNLQSVATKLKEQYGLRSQESYCCKEFKVQEVPLSLFFFPLLLLPFPLWGLSISRPTWNLLGREAEGSQCEQNFFGVFILRLFKPLWLHTFLRQPKLVTFPVDYTVFLFVAS